MSDTEALYDVVEKALANWGDAKAHDALEALMGRLRAAEKEREEDQGVIRVWRGRTERAEADNAALIAKILTYKHGEGCGVEDEWDPLDTEGCKCVLKLCDTNHPGAALLEELEGLRKQVAFKDGKIDRLEEDVRSHFSARQNTEKVCHALRAELTTARNAALEEAAKRADEEAESSRAGRLQASQWGHGDVAMKYDGRAFASECLAKSIRALKTGQRP